MSYVNILQAGTDHTMWMKGLEFYKDELDLMQARLEEVAEKNSLQEAGRGVEHFQNQFMIQQKNISDLKHEVKAYVKALTRDASNNAGEVDELFIRLAHQLRERYEQLELIMNALRHEFNDFLSRWI
jgi:septal ring factor EnvC (AmiA/AmiB activator)